MVPLNRSDPVFERHIDVEKNSISQEELRLPGQQLGVAFPAQLELPPLIRLLAQTEA
jgi:hypothetical protein